MPDLQLFIVLVLLLIFLPIALGGLSMAPWVPTLQKDLWRIGQIVQLKKGEIFYELGCGDARVSRFIAEKFPEATIIGLDISYYLVLFGTIKKCILGQKNCSIKMKDLFRQNLSDARVIYVFGMPDSLNKRLKEKFQKELKKGTQIISYAFKIKDWEPLAINQPDLKSAKIYVYEV